MLHLDKNRGFQTICGGADTRNVGLALAVGEYISFIDSDDYIQHTMMQEMVMIFKEYFKCMYIEPSSCCDKMFRASVIEGLRFPYGKTSEDLYFSYWAFLNAKRVVHVAKPFYYYCHRMGSVCNTFPVDLSELDLMDFVNNIEKQVWKKRQMKIVKVFYSFYTSTFIVLHEEMRKSAKVDSTFYKYMIKLKMNALMRLVCVLANPDVLQQKKKEFIESLLRFF